MGKHLINHRLLKVKDAIKGNCPEAVTLLALQPILPTKSTVDIRLDRLLPWDGLPTYLLGHTIYYPANLLAEDLQLWSKKHEDEEYRQCNMANIVTKPWQKLWSVGWRLALDGWWPQSSGVDLPPSVYRHQETKTKIINPHIFRLKVDPTTQLPPSNPRPQNLKGLAICVLFLLYLSQLLF